MPKVSQFISKRYLVLKVKVVLERNRYVKS